MFKISLLTTEAYAEQLNTLFNNAGATAVTLTDAGDEPLFDEKSNEALLWKKVKLDAFFIEEIALEQMVSLLKVCFPSEALEDIRTEPVENQDWVKRCQDQFQPIQIDNKLWICPKWCKPIDKDAINVMINPGLAFGTGEHPTTQLCLQWLASHTKGKEIVIDYGCGSGILALSALKLGAIQAYCVDNDPQALEATEENAKLNHFDASQLFLALPEEMPHTQADIIVANILAKPLISLAPTLISLLKTGGALVLSGILSNQEMQVRDAYAPHFKTAKTYEKDGWVCLVFE